MKHNKYVGDSIKHWIDMIRWMKAYPGWFYEAIIVAPKDFYLFMESQINQTPYGEYCPLCKKYQNHDNQNCAGCPIDDNNCLNPDSPWQNVIMSTTKSDWLKSAYKMLKVLWEARHAE